MQPRDLFQNSYGGTKKRVNLLFSGDVEEGGDDNDEVDVEMRTSVHHRTVY
jgi:hypothetical protein